MRSRPARPSEPVVDALRAADANRQARYRASPARAKRVLAAPRRRRRGPRPVPASLPARPSGAGDRLRPRERADAIDADVRGRSGSIGAADPRVRQAVADALAEVAVTSRWCRSRIRPASRYRRRVRPCPAPCAQTIGRRRRRVHAPVAVVISALFTSAGEAFGCPTEVDRGEARDVRGGHRRAREEPAAVGTRRRLAGRRRRCPLPARRCRA